MTTRARAGDPAGVPSVRRWSLAELGLSGVLLALAAASWVLVHLLSAPGMSTGILTGARPMTDAPRSPTAVLLFLVAWTVMMAAMMLPSIVPFTIGISRLMRARGGPRAGLPVLTVGYFLVWIGIGAVAYALLAVFERVPGTRDTAPRVGAAVLVVAGVYQLTPLKRVCLRHCRSPVLLVMQHGSSALASRAGAFRVGLVHGGYCLGCCWALMTILLAAGAMSLTWMALIAALIAVEKLSRRAELVSWILGGLLVAAGLALLVSPGTLPAVS
jgi:predicted metal-binding membrane protein